jgi:hypothetical protein
MENAIENKVAQSGLIQLDLETIRIPGERIFFDIRPLLFMDLVLKEKDFRAFLGDHAWNQYQGKHVAISCSSDAIIPTWAFMLISAQMSPFASTIVYGNLADLEKELFTKSLLALNLDTYRDGRVVVKGCSKEAVPTDAYVRLTTLLQPIVKSLFFGEPCSTVPIYKKKITT